MTTRGAELLFLEGCPAWRGLLARAHELADERSIALDIVLSRVDSLEQARAARFLGSPTLRVEGVDVDPAADARSDFGYKCRLYPTAGGGRGPLPPDRWIVEALRAQPPDRGDRDADHQD